MGRTDLLVKTFLDTNPNSLEVIKCRNPDSSNIAALFSVDLIEEIYKFFGKNPDKVGYIRTTGKEVGLIRELRNEDVEKRLEAYNNLLTYYMVRISNMKEK